jgi:hypothetical protein
MVITDFQSTIIYLQPGLGWTYSTTLLCRCGDVGNR